MRDDERRHWRIRYRVTAADENGYPMVEERDYQILAAVKALEATTLSPQDDGTVKLIRSQLLNDWRGPLLERLSALREKYGC